MNVNQGRRLNSRLWEQAISLERECGPGEEVKVRSIKVCLDSVTIGFWDWPFLSRVHTRSGKHGISRVAQENLENILEFSYNCHCCPGKDLGFCPGIFPLFQWSPCWLMDLLFSLFEAKLWPLELSYLLKIVINRWKIKDRVFKILHHIDWSQYGVRL